VAREGLAFFLEAKNASQLNFKVNNAFIFFKGSLNCQDVFMSFEMEKFAQGNSSIINFPMMLSDTQKMYTNKMSI